MDQWGYYRENYLWFWSSYDYHSHQSKFSMPRKFTEEILGIVDTLGQYKFTGKLPRLSFLASYFYIDFKFLVLASYDNRVLISTKMSFWRLVWYEIKFIIPHIYRIVIELDTKNTWDAVTDRRENIQCKILDIEVKMYFFLDFLTFFIWKHILLRTDVLKTIQSKL